MQQKKLEQEDNISVEEDALLGYLVELAIEQLQSEQKNSSLKGQNG